MRLEGRFTVKENDDGQSFIAFESGGQPRISLLLTSSRQAPSEARQVASQLNASIAAIVIEGDKPLWQALGLPTGA